MIPPSSRRQISSSRVCMPASRPVCSTLGSWWVLASRMRLRTLGMPMRISCAATRPGLSTRRKRVCETTARKLSARLVRTWAWESSGKTSMMRSMVLCALWVCRVLKTRCPVSAASRASRMVSRSRISPTRMMSGSSRRAPRRAALKLPVSRPTSRWLMRQPWGWCTNSMGSSMVRMWSRRFLLAWSMMAARVVLLPLPVGPVTSTRPLFSIARSRRRSGRPSCSTLMISCGISRNTAEMPRCCMK